MIRRILRAFSVLKDASATAVYGTRGANGVVLVTTKRGEVDKLKITGRANLTVSHLQNMPEYLGAYDYATLANEAKLARGEEALYSPMALDLIKYQPGPRSLPECKLARPDSEQEFPATDLLYECPWRR